MYYLFISYYLFIFAIYLFYFVNIELEKPHNRKLKLRLRKTTPSPSFPPCFALLTFTAAIFTFRCSTKSNPGLLILEMRAWGATGEVQFVAGKGAEQGLAVSAVSRDSQSSRCQQPEIQLGLHSHTGIFHGLVSAVGKFPV